MRRRAFPGIRRLLLLALALLALLVPAATLWELRTSRLQAHYLARYAARLDWRVAPGASAAPLRAPAGPYDVRLGYAQLEALQTRLVAAEYRIISQAEPAPEMRALAARHIAPPFREKSVAGLQIVDADGRALFDARQEQSAFREFVDIPALVVAALLYVEDRDLLDPGRARRNPALEWDRLALSGWRYALDVLFGTGNISGGSTLATQVQKFRHSPAGRSWGVKSKAQQLVGASLAAYHDGEDTRRTRQDIVVAYLNDLPLGAAPGVGEVRGLGAGLGIWFGKSVEQLVVDLTLPETGEALARKAESFQQALALVLATRRPALYLGTDPRPLRKRLDFYLTELATAGVISPELAAAARAQPLHVGAGPALPPSRHCADRKAANAMRNELVSLLGLRSYYELDRLDPRVETSLDVTAQKAVVATLQSLKERETLGRLGFLSERVLEHGDPARVVYTVSLYRSDPAGNHLLVHADNLDRPLDLNDGTKLELGSTAKLRTLANYLVVVARLVVRQHGWTRQQLRAESRRARDPLRRWTAAYLAAHPGATLPQVLDASLERTYSANPRERFYTGRGLHTFANFDSRFEGDLSLRAAFRHSVNLVFIRLLRDLVEFYTAECGYDEKAILAERNHPDRRALLDAALAQEAREQLRQAYARFGGLDADAAVRLLCGGDERELERFALFFLYQRPDATPEVLRAAMVRLFPDSAARAAAGAAGWVRELGGRRLGLAETAWRLRRQPLEIWLLREKQTDPGASLDTLIERSATEREEAYAWLLGEGAWKAQNLRLRSELEQRAFARMHADWQELGYPFGTLVPSLATAIGSSADRPTALAELVGIVLNDGLRAPTHRITALHLGEATPYETHFAAGADSTRRVMPAAVARSLRDLMQDVVENGTARRVQGSMRCNGEPVRIGGKTGSGDNRHEIFRPDGRLLGSRPLNRTASFVFFIDALHYGVITAHVDGEAAGDFDFTSALALQVFNTLAPVLEPFLESGEAGAVASRAPISVPTQDVATSFLPVRASHQNP